MEVPGVDHDPPGQGVVDQRLDLVVVGLGLRERVVQRDVDVVDEGLVVSSSATTTRSRYGASMLATPMTTTS